MDGCRSEWMDVGVNGWSYERINGVSSEWMELGVNSLE